MQISISAILLIIISTILSITTEYFLTGIDPIFSLQVVNQINNHLTFFDVFIFAFFGIIVGIISEVFIRGVYVFVDLFNKCFVNAYLRHMTGMLLIGFMIFFTMNLFGHYYIEGVGFATVQDCLNNQISSI